MSSVLPTDTQAVMARRQAVEADVTRPDFQYWHEVFDQTHGREADPMRSNRFDLPPSALDESLSLRRECVVDAAQPMVSQRLPQAPSLASSANARGVIPSASIVDGLASVVNGAGIPVSSSESKFSGVRCASAGLARMVEDAAEAAQTPLPFPAPDEPQAEAGIHAHVMLTETGGLRVALRVQRGLSMSQALAAAAQAVGSQDTSGGHVEQVILNGERIYQNTSERPVKTGASSSFELKC